MRLDGVLIERVDLRHLGVTAGSHDLGRHGLKAGKGASGETNASSFARKYTRDSAAHRSSRPVDHGILVCQQHCHPPIVDLAQYRSRREAVDLTGLRALRPV